MPGDWLIDQALEEMKKNNATEVLVDLGQDLGYLNLALIQQIPKSSWYTRSLAESALLLPRANPQMPARNALEALGRAGVPLLGVSDETKLIGIVTAADLQQLYELSKSKI